MPAFMKPLVPAPLLEVIIANIFKPLLEVICKTGIEGISLSRRRSCMLLAATQHCAGAYDAVRSFVSARALILRILCCLSGAKASR